jgi:membrane peptidoglycan carboxypeptidase
MPETAKQAVVAGENETFWDDPGISIPGLMRAAASLVGPGDAVGGSTITQQYVKVMYLTQDKTFTRKLTEISWSR